MLVYGKFAFTLQCRIDKWERGLNEIEQISKEVLDIARINLRDGLCFH